MRKRRRQLAALFLAVATAFSAAACGKAPDVNSVLTEGASDFQEGKQEEDLALVSSDEILNRLIDEFSGSHSEPEGEQISDDEADEIRDNTDDDSVIGGSGGTGDGTDGTDGSTGGASGSDGSDGDGSAGDTADGELVIASRDDLKQAMHQMFDETKEVMNFRCEGGYLPDIDEVKEVYLELEREDAFDVICLGRYGISGTADNMMIFYEYNLETDQLIQMKEETRSLLAQAESQINVEGLSDYEIVCAVNDYLCDTIVYPESEPYAEETHTAYSAFKNGSAVCDGYARAAKLLLNDYGIECDLAVGECIPDGGHAWNLVNLDGEWYHMDVTWNDGGAEWDENARSAYLLVTDDFMGQSRVWDEAVYPDTPAEPYAG